MLAGEMPVVKTGIIFPAFQLVLDLVQEEITELVLQATLVAL